MYGLLLSSSVTCSLISSIADSSTCSPKERAVSEVIAGRAWSVLEEVRMRSMDPYVPLVRSDSLKL